MNAVLKPAGTEKSSEQAFFENQKLPPEKRGVTFEALFYKQLHNVTARIHDTENLEQIMLEASPDICKLAERRPADAVCGDRRPFGHRLQGEDRAQHQPRTQAADQTPQSLAGYVGLQQASCSTSPTSTTKRRSSSIHPALAFLKEVDKRFGLPHPPDAGGTHRRRRHAARRVAGDQPARAASLSATWTWKASRSCARRWPPRSASGPSAARRRPASARRRKLSTRLVADGAITEAEPCCSAVERGAGTEGTPVENGC